MPVISCGPPGQHEIQRSRLRLVEDKLHPALEKSYQDDASFVLRIVRSGHYTDRRSWGQGTRMASLKGMTVSGCSADSLYLDVLADEDETELHSVPPLFP
jgi:hypothetical protein